jgi:hypothetical protein
MAPDPIRPLRDRLDELKVALADIGDLRPGSLVERYRRCGKANCHCAGEGAAGHGPSWSLTREVAGKTVTSVIPAAAVEQTRQQIAEYRRFKTLTKEVIDTSGKLCEAQLSQPEAASKEAAKKRASKLPSKPRLSRKSKR